MKRAAQYILDRDDIDEARLFAKRCKTFVDNLGRDWTDCFFYTLFSGVTEACLENWDYEGMTYLAKSRWEWIKPQQLCHCIVPPSKIENQLWKEWIFPDLLVCKRLWKRRKLVHVIHPYPDLMVNNCYYIIDGNYWFDWRHPRNYPQWNPISCEKANELHGDFIEHKEVLVRRVLF